jgi:hypothetical protein
MKEKNKKMWHQVRSSSSLSGESSFPCSTEMQQTLIFWPLRLLVLHAVATLRPVYLCVVEDRQYGRLDLHRKGVMWYSDHYSRYCRGMDVVVME